MKIANFIGGLLGLERYKTSPSLNLIQELDSGKLILVDAGIHSPVQRRVREITLWDEFVEEKTVEIRCWSSFFSAHPNRMKFIDHDYDGERKFHTDNVRFFGNTHYPDYNEKIADGDLPGFVEQIKASIKSTCKTVISIRYHCESEIVKIEEILKGAISVVQSMTAQKETLPLFMIELSIMYDIPRIQSLIKDLHALGPKVVVVRLVDTPTPTSNMNADIHIVERSPFLEYLNQEAEVLLKSGTYATVTPFYQPPLRRRWVSKEFTRPIPSIEEYNAEHGRR